MENVLASIGNRVDGLGAARARLVRGAAGGFILKATATGLAFATSVLLARLLGAAEYGIYAWIMALVGLLTTPATLGLPNLVVRWVAAYQTRADWSLLRGLLLWVGRTTVLASLGLAAVTGLLAGLVAGWVDAQGSLPIFWLALPLIPLMSLTAIGAAVVRGLGHVVVAQVPEALVRPGLLIALVAAAAWSFEGFGVERAIGLQLVAAAAAFSLALGLMMRRLPRPVRGAPPAFERQAWFRSALPLLLAGGMQVVNSHTDVLMLGALAGAEAAGVYRIAAQGAMLLLFGLGAVNAALAPTIAGLYAASDMRQLQLTVTLAARAVLLWSLPLALLMIVFGRWLLGAIFGADFAGGATALAILSGAQLLNTFVGSVGILLTMTGHERDTAQGFVLAALVNVSLNALLIPPFGIEGAAVATGISIIAWNVLLTFRVWQRLRIHATALGRIGFKDAPGHERA